MFSQISLSFPNGSSASGVAIFLIILFTITAISVAVVSSNKRKNYLGAKQKYEQKRQELLTKLESSKS